MHDNRVHADLLHQDDIAGKFIHRLVAAHGVTAQLDHNRRTGIALQIGQGLLTVCARSRSSRGSCLVVLVLHAIPAMMARSVAMPSALFRGR